MKFVEAAAAGGGVDGEERLAVADPLLAHGAVLLLPNAVQDVVEHGAIVDVHLLAVAVVVVIVWMRLSANRKWRRRSAHSNPR